MEKKAQDYCEQSGGNFIDDLCHCPAEFGEDVYYPENGTCQTTHGGPGGNLGIEMNEMADTALQLEACKQELNLLK